MNSPNAGPSWGVDSADPVNAANWDTLLRLRNRAPDFWGRYIGGLYAVTAAEISFLHQKGCRVLVAYNGATASSVSGSQSAGQTEAATAIKAAKALHMPAGVFIYADIEASWAPSVAWLDGWVTGIVASSYGPGFYCNPLSTHAFGGTYDKAYKANKSAFARTRLWSSEPEPYFGSECAKPPPEVFAPAYPTTNQSGTVIWQYVESCVDAPVDADLANDHGMKTMW